MRFGHYLAAAAASFMTVSPAVAANPAAKLSVAQSSRTGSPAADDSELAGFSGIGTIAAVVVTIAIVAGFVLIVSDDDSPDSP